MIQLLQQCPEGACTNQKRSLRRKSEKFVSVRQWISSKEKQNRVIAACHNDNLGGHLGRDKTRDKITIR